ncbi:MAG: hypothetical protein WCL08_04970, partial [Verrucomicrobiota bacterium]
MSATLTGAALLAQDAEPPQPAGLAVQGAPSGGELPVPFPPQRYTALLEKSPFAIASAPPEPVPVSTENFATNWILTGISKQRDPEGKERFTVFVRSRDLATRLVITGDQPSDDGVSLVSVEEASIPAKSVAFLKKGNETGRVEFDQATVAAATPAPASPS